MPDRDLRALRIVGVTFLVLGIVLTVGFALALYVTHERVFYILILSPGLLFMILGGTFFGVSHARPKDKAPTHR